jgi:hypothetical protein
VKPAETGAVRQSDAVDGNQVVTGAQARTSSGTPVIEISSPRLAPNPNPTLALLNWAPVTGARKSDNRDAGTSTMSAATAMARMRTITCERDELAGRSAGESAQEVPRGDSGMVASSSLCPVNLAHGADAAGAGPPPTGEAPAGAVAGRSRPRSGYDLL